VEVREALRAAHQQASVADIDSKLAAVRRAAADQYPVSAAPWGPTIPTSSTRNACSNGGSGGGEGW
jgi:hypothetical protein